MNETSQGQIVTFYSYKGGTGRTMALANVAWILANNGKRVLSVDWDLESPGLHKFFHPFLDESTVSATPGVIEIINDYASAAVDPGPRSDEWHLELAQVERHAVSLDWTFPEGGRLDFLSAGRQNRDYSAAVCSLDWDNFYDRLGGGRFFRAMREDMKQKYDYVLIDSRTGLSDVADICTIELPDVLAICFTLSDQSIEGAANVARQISGRYRDRNIRVLPFPMRIEDGEKEKLDVGRALARMKFEGFPAGMTPESSALYWASVEVPYKPFYAFEETLATFGDDPGSPASLLSSFERVTDWITAGDVTTHAADSRRPPAAVQGGVRPQAARGLHPGLPQLRAGRPHVGRLDGGRADPGGLPCPAAQHRDDRGHAATTPAAASRPSANCRTLRAPSPSCPRRTCTREMPGRSGRRSRRPTPPLHRQLIPVRISDVRVTEPFNEHPVVDLARMDAAQATAKLLWALDRPAQPLGSMAVQAEEPRFPGTIPPIWNVPPRNADFTGRGATLELLRDKLAGGGRAVVVAQALYGLGGVGKTQLALEYAHRFMADYDLVWWVPSERAEETNAALADLARKMGLRPATTWRKPRRPPWRSCAATPPRTGCSSSTTPTTLSSWSRSCPPAPAMS